MAQIRQAVSALCADVQPLLSLHVSEGFKNGDEQIRVLTQSSDRARNRGLVSLANYVNVVENAHEATSSSMMREQGWPAKA
jgi:hypothetical protein